MKPIPNMVHEATMSPVDGEASLRGDGRGEKRREVLSKSKIIQKLSLQHFPF